MKSEAACLYRRGVASQRQILKWGGFGNRGFSFGGDSKLMTEPHRSAKTIGRRMVKTGRQFDVALRSVCDRHLSYGRLPAQIKRAIDKLCGRPGYVFR